jgi:hypothetical protein
VKRACLFLLALVLLACHGHVPAPSKADAGAPPPPAQHAPEPDPSSAMAATAPVQASISDKPRARHVGRSGQAAVSGAPADPRVLECAGRPYKDWPSVRDCILAEAPVAVTDAGHKFGAVRPNVAANPAWLVPAWYVNASTGNDENTCVTSGAPCKTYGEIVNRWQTSSPVLVQATTLNFLVDTTELVNWSPVIAQGGAATILGTLTTVASGTLGTVTPLVRTRTPEPRLQAVMSATQGQMLVNSGHPSVAWVDSVSGGTAILTQPFLSNVPAFGAFETEVTGTTSGDAYTLQVPTTVPVGAFLPTVINQPNAFAAGFIGHVWVPDQSGTPCTNNLTLNNLVRITESRVDTVLQYSDTYSPDDGMLGNSFVAGMYGVVFVQGGSFGSVTSCFSIFRGVADADVIFHGMIIDQSSKIGEPTVLGLVYCDGGDLVVSGDLNIQTEAYGGASLYGSCRINPGSLGSTSAKVTVQAPAASTLVGGTTMAIDSVAFASAYDTSIVPGQWYPRRALSPAQLDATIASGGLGGNAYGDTGAMFTEGVQTSASPGTYVAPVPNGGTGDTSGAAHAVAVWEGTSPMAAVGGSCTGGNVLTCNSGADPSFQAPASAVSSVTGYSGVSCSPTTGAVNCTNTGVTSVTAGSGISVSASTGSVTISNTALFTNNVPSGATGFTSCLAGDFVQGNGSSPLQCTSLTAHTVVVSEGAGVANGVGPGTSGFPLISQGLSSDPHFSQLQIGGGGTGVGALAAGNILLGGSTVNTLAPGTAGNVATSNGSTFISQAPLVTNFAESTGFVSTISYSAVTTITSVAITAPSAGFLMIHENFMAANAGTGPAINVEFGAGVDSTAFARVETVSTVSSGNTAMSVSYRASVSSGSHTIYALGIGVPASGPTITADADISVAWTAN